MFDIVYEEIRECVILLSRKTYIEKVTDYEERRKDKCNAGPGQQKSKL